MRFLILDKVSMGYGSRALFDNVTCSISQGEALVVTGANGSGKSTLLKIAAGLIRPESGVVERDTEFGYASPEMNPYIEMTGAENIAFFSGLRGLEDESQRLLALVGLSNQRGGELVATYSSGMRQRLKLALSLLGSPPLLIWDEPTMALDNAGRNAVNAILDRHRGHGGIAVLATNDSDEAERWSRGGARLDLAGA